MSYWIDSHAHIYLEDFNTDREEVLRACEAEDVRKIYMPNIDHTSIDPMLEVESRAANCFAMMGLHPCSVKKDFEKELYIIEQWLSKRKFVAIGEIGTDLYWDKTYWEQQQEAFKIQAGWAKQYGLPIVIHCRESLDETIALVRQLKDDTLTGIFHCFSGSVKQANEIAELGFYLGIGGVATFKNSGLDKVLPVLGVEKLVLETDSPYLAPVPHRGKRNEPTYIPKIGERVAELAGIDIKEVKTATTRNAEKIFDHQ